MSTLVSATAVARVRASAPLAPLLMLSPRRLAACPHGKLAGHHSLDQPGVDQQPVEAPDFGAAGALEKQSVTALENLLLFREGRIERQPGRLLHDDRKIGRLEAVQRRRDVLWREVDTVERVVGREVARV